MKRGYIIYPVVGSFLLLTTPTYAEGPYIQNTKKQLRILGGKISGFNQHLKGDLNNKSRPTPAERMLGAKSVGRFLENATQIPGLQRGTERIEKGNISSGFYDHQRKTQQTGPEKVRNLFRRK